MLLYPCYLRRIIRLNDSLKNVVTKLLWIDKIIFQLFIKQKVDAKSNPWWLLFKMTCNIHVSVGLYLQTKLYYLLITRALRRSIKTRDSRRYSAQFYTVSPAKSATLFWHTDKFSLFIFNRCTTNKNGKYTKIESSTFCEKRPGVLNVFVLYLVRSLN